MISINLENQKNIRDLGGTETEDGRRIKPNKLIRSGRLSELNASDAALLLGNHRVRTIVDLRSAKENDERPNPQWGIVEYFRIPLLTDDQMGFGAFAAAGSPEGKRNVLDTLISMTSSPSYTPSQYLMDVYRKLITTKQAQAAVRRFFEVLLSHKDGALLYHCNGGKDRTGIITALLMTALKVPWDTIAEDYMETNVIMEPVLEQKFKHIPEKYRTPQAKSVLRMMYLANAGCLQAAHEEMCAVGGSPAGYLKQEIGLTDFTIRELQNRLLF